MSGFAETSSQQTPKILADRPGTGPRERAREVGACLRRIEELERRAEEMDRARRRLTADFRSYRWRTAEAVWTARRTGTRDALRAVLPIVDHLERALAAGSSGPVFLQGIRALATECQEILAGLGVRPVPGVGARFDPRVHEAVGTGTDDRRNPDDTVATEVLRGYLHEGELLRPAKVTVARGTQSRQGCETLRSEDEGGRSA